MSGGSSSPKQKVTEYNMSIHFGICQGPVDYLYRIRVNEKDAWLGSETDQTTLLINNKSLFGGVKKEGGVAGEVHYQKGDFVQKISAKLASKLGLTPDDAPGYRGIATAFFTDSSATALPGFYWSANQPYIPPVDFQVTRLTKSWYPERALIAAPPKEPVAVSFTIDDSGSMADGNRLSTMKEAVTFALERIRGAVQGTGLRIDLHIGKWGGVYDERVYLDASAADITDAINYVNAFSASSGGTNFDLAAQGALDFFNQTIGIDNSTENPTVTLQGVTGQVSFGEGGQATIFIPDQGFQGTPIPPVENGDEVTLTLANDSEITFTVQYVINNGQGSGQTWYLSTNIAHFEAQTVEMTNPYDPGSSVSNLGNLGARVWIFITDGLASGTSDDDAANIASDLLNRSSGNFRTPGQPVQTNIFDPNSLVNPHPDDTSVDVYGININEEDTSSTTKLDNTPQDGVPVVGEDEPAKLLNVIQRAIFGGIPPDLNAAHIIHECLTNSSWGMGAPVSQIEDQTFRDAADTLFFEGFGLSMIWVRQKEIEGFVQEVLDHIEANLYVDPATGKFNLKLIRDDYDEETLPVLDESNSTVSSYSRRSPAEIINEISVTWTNPENEKEEILTIQDLGGIVQSGGQVIPDSRNYYGIRRKDLAWTVAQRDISAATARLSTAEIDVDRSAWKLVPGAVFKLRSEEHGVDDEIMRIVKINYGSPGDSSITINATQDIYSFERPQYTLPPDTEIETGSQLPTVFDSVRAFTLPYFLTGYYVDPASLLGVDYPDVWVGFVLDTTNTDALEFELVAEETDLVGTVSLEPQGTRSIAARGILNEEFPLESETITSGFGNLSIGIGPEVGGFGYIISPGMPERVGELILFTAFDGTNWTVKRGILDTIPRRWGPGQRIYFFGPSSEIADETVRAAMEEVPYKTLMRTSLGTMDQASAPLRTYETTERPHLPNRPANVTVQGIAWDDVDAEGEAEITVAWANRNRLEEDSQILAWDDPNVAPEPGQTTKITIINQQTGDVENEITGLTGESYAIPAASFGAATRAIVRVTAERDGFESLTGYEQRVKIAGGYGYGYGLSYGE